MPVCVATAPPLRSFGSYEPALHFLPLDRRPRRLCPFTPGPRCLLLRSHSVCEGRELVQRTGLCAWRELVATGGPSVPRRVSGTCPCVQRGLPPPGGGSWALLWGVSALTSTSDGARPWSAALSSRTPSLFCPPVCFCLAYFYAFHCISSFQKPDCGIAWAGDLSQATGGPGQRGLCP